ncbi:MAG TPA: hypothetical protein VM841_02770 [Actinomycetota bacterium]|nr:hypothetical protein [Actinomycetota bacterium]
MRIRSLIALSALVAGLATVAEADPPQSPVTQARSVEPVVLTGSQFPSWSAGPDPAFREPQTPTNYETADTQGSLPATLRSDCYRAGQRWNPYDWSDNGDHNCYQRSRVPANPLEGADVSRLLAYRWNGTDFEQIPFQVDEVFTRYISNNVSGFAFYSGVDEETTYAFDREPFHYNWDAYLDSLPAGNGNPCASRPRPGSPMHNGKATTPDPVRGLDDNDELVFMYSDTGGRAPRKAAMPSGLESTYEVKIVDPSNPLSASYVYVALAAPDGPRPSFDAGNGYVRYVRDANADLFVYSQSSYTGYGAAPKGPYCDLDGTIVTTPRRPQDVPAQPAAPNGWAVEQRRPLDTAWVKTPRYWFRYDGRWLMTGLRISPDDSGLSASPNLGPDIVDQWKARAFQQRPGGRTPCCGYEEEVNNWGGSSILFGERVGAVRAIRAAFGADSSTNNVKTEIFYRDEIRFGDKLRVHVIPPADGIYVQWDYNAGKVSTYYNPWVSTGAPIDGQNDEVFGNTRWHVAQDRIEFRDDDPIPVIGPQHITIPGPGAPSDCRIAGQSGICNDMDFADPFFSGPAATLNWEQISGPNGSLVTRWQVRKHTGGDAYALLAQPYYRDDSCFDDGTGSDPGPHLRSRAVDDGVYGTYVDPQDGLTKSRVCWTPADGDPSDISINDGRPRKFWQGDIATHGVHIQFIADSDNANLTKPVNEIDFEQRMVVLPGNQPNVGERYGRAAEMPLVTVVTPRP